MKSAFWASLALASAPAVLAQGLRQATGGPEGTPVDWYPSPSPEVSDCKANLITTLCEYKSPGPEFAVASSGKAHCWEYCNGHPPCNFVIFAAGNPYTGTGTCWLYPGEDFDKSIGKEGCDYLSVFDKPDCGTPTAGACEATASPSAIATVCDYPAPDDDCWSSCSAQTSSSGCLSQCVESDSCAFAIFNPRTESMSPHSSGTCWMYPSGKYDPSKAKTCSGKTEQYVYENPCPKPKPSTTSSPSAAASATGTSTSKDDSSSEASPTGTGSSRPNAEAEGATDGGDGEGDGNGDSKGSAATALSLGGPLAVGLAVTVLTWQGLRL